MKNKNSTQMLIDALSKLSPEKKIIVRKLGFASLLDFSCSSNVDQIFKWLMNRFDTESYTVTLENGFSFTITPSFVYNILGIPFGPDAIQMRSNLEDHEFINELLNGQTPKVEYLCSVLTMELDELTFSRLFLILIIDAFIAPTPTGSASQLLYHYVVNIKTVSTLDWCSFALKMLLDSIDILPIKQTTRNGSSNRRMQAYLGCKSNSLDLYLTLHSFFIF
jgi:hypothetical protein